MKKCGRQIATITELLDFTINNNLIAIRIG